MKTEFSNSEYKAGLTAMTGINLQPNEVKMKK
jgi:hypothetical protein